MKVEEVISRVAELCRQHDAQKVILYGSRAKGTALERSDIDIAVSGVKDFDTLSYSGRKSRRTAYALQCRSG